MKKKEIYNKFSIKTGQIAVLVDPDKTNTKTQLQRLVQKLSFAKIDFIFVGGSTVNPSDLTFVVDTLKQLTSIPLILFPGDASQFTDTADAILYLSLLSGRNPEYLIGQHVKNAKEIYHSNIEVIPTAYLLIDGGVKTSVAYVSQTTPIPKKQYNIAINTALAGILQGKKAIYFDAGSGAKYSIDPQLIQEIRKQTNAIIIVGGGVRSVTTLQDFQEAGANIIVIGNKIEESVDFLLEIEAYKRNENNQHNYL